MEPLARLAGVPHIRFELHPVAEHAGGALYARRGDRAVIVIDPAMGRVERRATLAHEFVHDERGGGADTPGAPGTWAAVVAATERQLTERSRCGWARRSSRRVIVEFFDPMPGVPMILANSGNDTVT